MSVPTPPPTPPGWYPDPGGAAVQRYWDGTQWTPNQAPYATATAASAPAAARSWYQSPGKVIGLVVGLVFLGTIAVLTVLALSNASKTVAGSDLARDVERVISSKGLSVSAVTCDTAPAVKGQSTSCTATVEGVRTGIRVTWDDDQGHFHLDEETPR